MVGVVGFEPTTVGLEGRCSIQLSYTPKRGSIVQQKMGWPTGLEPATSGVTIRCSTC